LWWFGARSAALSALRQARLLQHFDECVLVVIWHFLDLVLEVGRDLVDDCLLLRVSPAAAKLVLSADVFHRKRQTLPQE